MLEWIKNNFLLFNSLKVYVYGIHRGPYDNGLNYLNLTPLNDRRLLWTSKVSRTDCYLVLLTVPKYRF